MFTRLLALQKVKVIATDLIPERLELARKWGAVAAENPELRIQNSEAVDAAIITAPSDVAAREALDRVRGGGQVLLFAHTKRGAEAPMDLAKICVDEKDLIGSYSSDITLQKEVAGLVFSRRLDVRGLISHRFPLADTSAAIDLAAKPSPGALKIVVEAGS